MYENGPAIPAFAARRRIMTVLAAVCALAGAAFVAGAGLARPASASTWQTVPANISTVTGTHNVYLEFASGAGGNPPYVSLHYFSFPAA